MLKLENFESWLEAHQDDEPVGIPGVATACPVARWAQELYNAPVDVSFREVRIAARDGGSVCIPVDTGLYLFIRYVDCRWPLSEIDACTARAAISAIRKVL